MLPLVVFVLLLSYCRADYECLCSYDVEKPVYDAVGLLSCSLCSVKKELLYIYTIFEYFSCSLTATGLITFQHIDPDVTCLTFDCFNMLFTKFLLTQILEILLVNKLL